MSFKKNINYIKKNYSLGIIGGLIIIKPTFKEFNYFYFMPLIFAFGFAQVALSIKSPLKK